MRLIDILNKIANGELKEGTKVKMGEHIYDVEIFSPITPLDKEFLNIEAELIEPDHFADIGKMAEPTDNTKIEELELGNTYLQDAIIQLTDKLNEVINKVNAQTVVVLSQEKDIEEIKNQLYY